MDWEFIVDRIGLNHNEIVITELIIDVMISPNHNEIVVTDPLVEWLISPNHNEIVIPA